MAKTQLDMFRRVLPSIDTRNKDFYNSLSDEEKKAFGPWLVQRYLSSVESSNNEIIEHYLIMTNEIVNINFGAINDPEMMWALMCIVGVGKSFKHPYIAPPGGNKKKKRNPFKGWLQEKNPHLSDQELDILIQNLDKEAALDILEQYHVKDKDIIAGASSL